MSSLTLMPSKRTDAKQSEVMDHLFLRLIAFYGNKFMDAYNGISMPDLKRIWSEELAGYGLKEIGRGIEACRSLKWPPTLPEFLAHCRPPIEPDVAYHEAVTNLAKRDAGQNPEYSHPAIFWAAQEVGPWDLKHTPAKYMARTWAHALRQQLDRQEWPAIPKPTLELPPPAGHKPSPEIQKRMQELTKKLRGQMPSPMESK